MPAMCGPILADNKLAEQAGWDRELLALELGDLRDLAVDLTSLDFDAGELDAFLNAKEADPREDDVPPVPARAIAAELTARRIRTRRGGVWSAGNVKGLLGRLMRSR